MNRLQELSEKHGENLIVGFISEQIEDLNVIRQELEAGKPFSYRSYEHLARVENKIHWLRSAINGRGTTNSYKPLNHYL